MSTPRGLLHLARDVVRSSRGHDLALYAAGVTFYAAIGLVPLLLVGLYLAGLIAGQDTVRGFASGLAGVLPDTVGASSATRFLADAGTRLRPTAVLAALVPASLYGEGLVRAFDRLSEHGDQGRKPLRGRIGSLVVVAFSPLVLLGGLAASKGVRGSVSGSLGATLLGVYVAFLVGWVASTVLLVFAYRGLAPERPCVRALLWGAATTGSFLSGTSLGLVLVLSLGLDLGRAYGGATALGVAALCLGWLFLLHVLVLVGYTLTLRLDARRGHPLGALVRQDGLRVAA